jgi:hypothetical protein
MGCLAKWSLALLSTSYLIGFETRRLISYRLLRTEGPLLTELGLQICCLRCTPLSTSALLNSAPNNHELSMS